VASVGYRKLLVSNRGYRNLWLGNVASFAGDWFNLIALYAAVAELSDSSVAIALVMVVKTLPSFLISPIAGPLVDRLDRRRLLLAMDFIRAGSAA
jgi:MFS family permease